MRPLSIIFILFIVGQPGFGQTISVGLAYNYLYAKPMNECIDVYNFSRPFLENKQKKLTHGISLDAGYLFEQSNPIKHGFCASYSYFGSVAKNTNHTNRFNLHLINLNYLIRFTNIKKISKLYTELHVGITSSVLNRILNGEAVRDDDKKITSMGIGGNIGFKIGYGLYKNNKHQLAPYIFCGYRPYLYAPKNESVINATQGLISTPFLNIMNFSLGVCYQFNKQPPPSKIKNTK